VFVDLVVKIEY